MCRIGHAQSGVIVDANVARVGVEVRRLCVPGCTDSMKRQKQSESSTFWQMWMPRHRVREQCREHLGFILLQCTCFGVCVLAIIQQ